MSQSVLRLYMYKFTSKVYNCGMDISIRGDFIEISFV